MSIHRRIGHVAVSLGLAAGALTATAGAAAAATPTCRTWVVAVTPSGRLMEREVTNTRIIVEKQTAAALPYRVDWLGNAGQSERTGATRLDHFTAFTAGQRPRALDIEAVDSSTTLTVKPSPNTYASGFPARLPAESSSYYRYGVDKRGNLKRWTWFGDGTRLWFGDPKLVARHMGGLKTLTFDWATKRDGRWVDVLYATTRSGALKQIQVPLKKPSRARIVTLERTGFAAYSAVSPSVCNRSGSHASLIYVDAKHNLARWYTVSRQFTPKSSNVVRRGLVGRGAEWRLHAVL